MNRRKLLTMVAGGTIMPVAVKAYKPQISESQIKEVFKRNGFYVTPHNMSDRTATFLVTQGDVVVDYKNSDYMKYVIDRENGIVDADSWTKWSTLSIDAQFINFNDLDGLHEELQYYSYNDGFSYLTHWQKDDGKYVLMGAFLSSNAFHEDTPLFWANTNRIAKTKEAIYKAVSDV